MKIEVIKNLVLLLIVASLWVFVYACSAVRTEFYRGETEYLYSQAKIAYASGDYEGARECFAIITSFDPDCAQAWAGLGNISYLEGDMDTALACYRKAGNIDPDLKTAIQSLSTAALFRKQRQADRTKEFNFHKIYDLLSSGKQKEFDRRISAATNLSEKAQNTMIFSRAELDDITRNIRRRLAEDEVPPATILFCGYFLLYNTNDGKVEAVGHIQHAAAMVDGKRRQEAFMVIGKYYQSHGEANKALLYVRAALAAGVPMKAVVPQIARIFKVPKETAIGRKTATEP